MAHEEGRLLLVPQAGRVIPLLIGHIAATARQMEDARANGGKVKPKPQEPKPEEGGPGEVAVATGRIPVEEAGGKDAKDSKDSKDSKKKAKEKKRPPVTVANLCVRNALLVHTLYSIAKEAEVETEGSAWPLLLASTDHLLPAFLTLLRPVQSRKIAWLNSGTGATTTTATATAATTTATATAATTAATATATAAATAAAATDALSTTATSAEGEAGSQENGSGAVGEDDDLAGAATAEMVSELGRNALIVLAEMADPANSRFDPDKGMRWAQHIIAHRRDLILLLLDIMANSGGNHAVELEKEKIAAADAAAEAAAAGAGAMGDAEGGGSGGGNGGNVDGGVVGGVGCNGDGSDAFRLTPDCAHIAAAAVFGIISWDPCMDQLLAVLGGDTLRRDGTAMLVSRVVALLADALPQPRRSSQGGGPPRAAGAGVAAGEGGTDEGEAEQEQGEGGRGGGGDEEEEDEEEGDDEEDDDGHHHPHPLDQPHDPHEHHHHGGGSGGPGGVEAAGLIARLTSTDAGRRALLTHAPGIVGYLLPCLRPELAGTLLPPRSDHS